MAVDLRGDLLKIVENILKRLVPEYEVRVFGSRATGSPKKYSDLDLVIMTDTPLPTLKTALLKDAFAESNLPIKVDIVDWSELNESFRELIAKSSVDFLQAGR